MTGVQGDIRRAPLTTRREWADMGAMQAHVSPGGRAGARLAAQHVHVGDARAQQVQLAPRVRQAQAQQPQLREPVAVRRVALPPPPMRMWACRSGRPDLPPSAPQCGPATCRHMP